MSEVLINALGFLSFLFGSLMLLGVVFGMIGSIFMSTKPLFQGKRVKRGEEDSRSKPKGEKMSDLERKTMEGRKVLQ